MNCPGCEAARKAQANAEARERRIVSECESWRRELEAARGKIQALEGENASLRARLPHGGKPVPLAQTMARIEGEKLK